MTVIAAHPRGTVSFGPFSLNEGGRLLTKDGTALVLGGRTLDILIVLISRPNEVVSKRDLMARVWPDVTVGEGSLRFHIASLRKALGDGKGGARYISTLAGRGYCFVAPVTHSNADGDREAAVANGPSIANLPSRLLRMVGRDESVLTLLSLLTDARFVTIVGAGGVGKTTIAVAVGHELIESFSGAVLFIDLGALSDPNLVATSIVLMLGLPVQTDDPTSGLVSFLRDKRILLILDTCEHLMETAATLMERIFKSAPQAHILATSREALRVEGEHVYRLEALACPPEDPRLTAAAVLSFPAAQLFMERAAASGARLNPSDSDAAIISRICRKLGGVALAIELAAGRVGTYGLRQTAALLEERLSLSWPGQRTAPQRQQTLKATLDWSYSLLSELERGVLRKLSIFVGYFRAEAAREVLTSESLDQALIISTTDDLVAKSMVVTLGVGSTIYYRLLEATRAYALEITPDDAEHTQLSARHATYYRKWLERTEAERHTLSSAVERTLRQADLANVRMALEWCFGVGGVPEIGIGLAAAAARFFWGMSLLTESHRWAERAIHALDEATRGTGDEMQLQATLGMSLMFARGEGELARAALSRSIAIANERGDARHQLALLVPLSAFHTRIREFTAALDYAKTGVKIAQTTNDLTAVAVARTLLGIALHFIGDLNGARAELEAALQIEPGDQQISIVSLGSGQPIWAGVTLARTLWLQGHPAQALDLARQTVENAASLDLSLTLALNWSIPVFLWAGDLQSAEAHIDRFIARGAPTNSGAPDFALGQGFRGQLAICKGDAKSGVESLQRCLEEFQQGHYELATEFNISLIEGLAATGQEAQAISLADENIERVKTGGDMCYMPELLRLKGSILLSSSQPRGNDGETYLMESLALSRRQGALAWELRTATNLAGLTAAKGGTKEARALLQPVIERFVDGSDTADLRAARRVLEALV